MVDAALFLDRMDLDAVQFSCRRQLTFVRYNAHLIPLRRLAEISFAHNTREGRVSVRIVPRVRPTRRAAGIVQRIEFEGTWEEVLAGKDQFQNAVRYSVPLRLKVATANMEWDVVKELFGDTPLTVRVSSAVLISEKVGPNTVGIQEFLRPFALVNCLKINEAKWPNLVAGACNDDFLQKCTENSITQLDLGVHGAVLSEDAVIDFCFGQHGDDNDPRHLTARFQCSADFIARLLEANRNCNRKGSITMDLTTTMAAAPDFAELTPYRVEGTQRRRFFDATTFLLPDEFDFKIDFFYRPWHQWDTRNCLIEVYRPAQPSQ
ncbi:hypothetical protein AAVH_35611 [Aphelenchoides avenae]|nr:hypothetical protein AAVH_35611 [Aphelenchus avenae]